MLNNIHGFTDGKNPFYLVNAGDSLTAFCYLNVDLD